MVNDRTGVLQRDSRFAWSTFGIHIDSTVHEFVPNSRVGSFGKGTDIDAYHMWFLVAASRACQVITEEVAKGQGLWRFGRPIQMGCTKVMSCG
jgi:hypothetical protein